MVQCSPKADRVTYVQVSYEYVALIEKGRNFIEVFVYEENRKFISELEDLLFKYFDS